MRCIKCRDKATIDLRRHNAAYCAPHFLDYVKEQVRRNIRRHRMFPPEARILVAVSGGKDSLALWDLLLELGYHAAGLHIHLGIGEYSENSAHKTREFAQVRGARLIEIDLASRQGLGISELARALRRPPCSGCGASKRYFFNRAALEYGFDVVATGHNLDDEAATLLGNLLHWQTEYLARQSPVLEATEAGLVRKAKPLFTLTERETAAYCILRGIDYVEEECPNALGAKSLLYKDVLNRLEAASPGSKQTLVQGFLDKLKPLLVDRVQRSGLRQCRECGQPTTTEVCAFCRMWQTALNRTRARAFKQPSEESKTITKLAAAEDRLGKNAAEARCPDPAGVGHAERNMEEL